MSGYTKRLSKNLEDLRAVCEEIIEDHVKEQGVSSGKEDFVVFVFLLEFGFVFIFLCLVHKKGQLLVCVCFCVWLTIEGKKMLENLGVFLYLNMSLCSLYSC